MQVSVLASGSKGNAIFVEMFGTRLLIDAGISARRINKALLELDEDIKNIDGVIITHEHRDHITGLPTLCKKYNLPVYSRLGTFKAMFCLDKLPEKCINPISDNFIIKDLAIEAFNISHDAADPVGYSIKSHNKKCTIATDLGFVTSNVQEAIDNSNVLVLEANHDPQMLQAGVYPLALKKRIMSNKGHLSNNDAAWALVRMKKQHPHIFLAHMSEENNCPFIAAKTITDIIKKQGIVPGTDLSIQIARQNETVTLCDN
ncbi:MBL fold metallo-hydrolase [Pectinatus sottacetonis]|uniref:MBL fold metallo-hydrolase n=1 Tax=Pectinatus sottacetonis TaxID=1002795 RepID=UPI0018C4C454|nr:MBL fold metallo-hydrolase [Pectinatus sottacetonis]